MKNIETGPKSSATLKKPVLWLLISLLICFSLTTFTIIGKIKVENIHLEQLALVQSIRINDVLKKQLYKTYALAALVVQAEGRVQNFDKPASFLLDDNAILNFILAPDGIVSHVFPQTGNENIIGLNFFTNDVGNKEALLAKETGQLVMGGPFTLQQGREGLVGRMPVYLDTEKENFWGLVSVTLKFPQVLEGAGLDQFTQQGLLYELWRISPDTGEKQVIHTNLEQGQPNSHFIENRIQLMNADWNLTIWPTQIWYKYPENIGLIVASLFISFLVMFVMQNSLDLTKIKANLDILTQHDQLTGLYNRRYFMDISLVNMEKTRRKQTDCFVILFDLDHFKKFNDNYGHLAGDEIIIQTAQRIKSKIRPYDVFARYGGGEFIISIFDIDRQKAIELTARLKSIIENENFNYENIYFQKTASFGVAQVIDYNFKRGIQAADEALYSAKKSGRNKIVFSLDEDLQKNVWPIQDNRLGREKERAGHEALLN